MSACSLKPCPFCGGAAKLIHLDKSAGVSKRDQNFGGSVIECAKCQASSAVEFEFKENLVSRWNRRSLPSPPPGGSDG